MAEVTSKKYSLNWHDLVKGFITAFISGGLAQLYQFIDTGNVPSLLQIKAAGMVALAAGIAYLIKNFFTPATEPVTIDEPKKP